MDYKRIFSGKRSSVLSLACPETAVGLTRSHRERPANGLSGRLLAAITLMVLTSASCSTNTHSAVDNTVAESTLIQEQENELLPATVQEEESAPVQPAEKEPEAVQLQEPASDAPLALVQGQKTDYVILLPDDPAPAVATAGRELAGYLRKITGVNFPARTESELTAQVGEGASWPPVLAVGPSRFVDKLLKANEIELGAPDDDSIYLHTQGPNLILTGSSERAVLYAAYTFLEDACGVRWWSSNVEHVPHNTSLLLPQLDTFYTPRIKYRDIYYADARTNPFSARLKLNGHMQPIGSEQGGHYRIIGLCHTFEQFLPGNLYFDEHPEWYSLRGGKRLKEDSQLCLTNEEMRKEFTRVALERIRKDPEAGYIGVSQNDNRNACQCPACRQVVAEEGAESGAILRFVNAVAADIEKEYPDFKIVTLAYQYTEKPPRITKPRDNVLVQLCSIEASFAQPLLTGEQNRSFSGNLNKWLAITPRLFIWDYLTNFSKSLVPFPNYRVMGTNIHDFSNASVVGMFCQGDSLSVTGDFLLMRAWVVSHMLWNPDADPDALRREFLTGYYGAAGESLDAYMMFLCDELEKSGAILKCDRGDTSTWLTMEALNEATKFFDQAQEAVAGDPTLSTRLEIARITLDNAWLEYLKRSPEDPITKAADYRGPQDISAAIDDFLAKTAKYGTRHYSESEKFSFYRERLKMWQGSLGRKSAPLPEGLPSASEVQVVGPWDIRMFAAGRWTELVDEDNAPYGGAVRLFGKFHQWAVQYRFPESLSGEWDLYAEVRCDELAGYTGTGMSIGIHDGVSKRNILDVKVPAGEIAGGNYTLVHLGTAKINPECFLFMAPAGKPEQPAPDLYMGRVILVKPAAATE
ncbi:DUF4838 domain-containing protein [Coraliomargarita parva]|uniref:DUF4838 domain-containing protein n=1 Tax=Coraliomargarita parva TaxID=3014050 RepID=UPI0022B31C54|nr:DUF4838 domain-containing protein [Coraliomargarita parva]